MSTDVASPRSRRSRGSRRQLEWSCGLARAGQAEAQEHAGQVLAQVIDLAEALPYRPAGELAYPPLNRLGQ